MYARKLTAAMHVEPLKKSGNFRRLGKLEEVAKDFGTTLAKVCIAPTSLGTQALGSSWLLHVGMSPLPNKARRACRPRREQMLSQSSG